MGDPLSGGHPPREPAAARSEAARAGRDPFRPLDGASLAAFRIAFGLLMTWEAVRHLTSGDVHAWFVVPSFHFTYALFSWVRPWPGAGMTIHFVLLAAAAAGLALGWRTRLCALLFGAGFGYAFLLEKARYLNHYYLVLLLALLLAIVPAASCASWDARRRGARAVPAWALLLLRTQLGLVYLHAGLAKLNADWLAGEPLRSWLAARADHPVLGGLLGHPLGAWVFSYGGLLLDLLAWPLLAARSTRVPTFALLLAFHLLNSTLFGIGVFPWLMIAATTLFFEPDWPRRVFARRVFARRVFARFPFARTFAEPLSAEPAPADRAASPGSSVPRRRLVLAFVVTWLAFQALFPLRHFLYPGSVHWTEEGHAFSWHMKLRGKSGEVSYRITDPASGEVLLFDPRAELAPWQARKLAGRPDMLLEYAHHLAQLFSQPGAPRPQVRATASVSLNGHPPRLLVDPTVDLAAEQWSLLWPSSWIVRANAP